MEIRIIIAAHKPYWMPEDPVYLPVQVGAAGKPSIRAAGSLGAGGSSASGADFARDDEGDNISSRNAGYCELTGLYWAWRNLKADAVGLAHYRRHFRGARGIAAGTQSAIVPIAIGDERKAVEVSARLLERGFLIPAIRYPTVARGKARLRVAISAAHDDAILATAAAEIAACLK